MTRRKVCCILGAAASPLFGQDVVLDARTVADSWLDMVDNGRYGESWDAAAAVFKKNVEKAQWSAMAAKVRDPLGKLESRTFLGAAERASLPGAPDGEYVVIQYRAEFTSKKGAVETITPMKDPDGVWRVSGYFIR